jgi:hypothetical protein
MFGEAGLVYTCQMHTHIDECCLAQRNAKSCVNSAGEPVLVMTLCSNFVEDEMKDLTNGLGNWQRLSTLR